MRRNTLRLAFVFMLAVTITGASAAVSSASGQCEPIVDHLEVTQAIQRDPCNDSIGCNTGGQSGYVPLPAPLPGEDYVTLVDGRATTVRVYVRPSAQCGQDDSFWVDATFSLKEEATALYNLVWHSDNGPILVDSSMPDWNRGEPDETLNLTFYPAEGQHRTAISASVRAWAT